MFSFPFSNQEMHNVCHSKFDRQRTFLVPAKLLKQFHCNAWVTFKYYIESPEFLVSLLHGLQEFC